MTKIERKTCINSETCIQPKGYPCIKELCTEYLDVKEVKRLLSEALSVIKYFAPNHVVCDKLKNLNKETL